MCIGCQLLSMGAIGLLPDEVKVLAKSNKEVKIARIYLVRDRRVLWREFWAFDAGHATCCKAR